jgi:PAS domain S-box-containing protein
MSASLGAKSSPRIGIRMCAAGRFVACLDCLLSIEFPAGAHYDTIAKRFKSHSCGSPSLSKDDDPLARAKTRALTSKAQTHFDFDHNAAPMWVFDNRTLACSAVNDAAIHDYGYSRKEFLSMSIADIRANEGMVPLSREISETGIHDSAKILGKHKKKDGSVIDVEITHSEVLFDGCIADIVTAVDVTGSFSIPVGVSSPLGE